MTDDGRTPMYEFGFDYGSPQLALYIKLEGLVGDSVHIC